ncbi:MAG TPA: hypothetical protein VGG68_00075 [Caulobacteraceae bacterium]|jgi:hypothetical protein
MPTQSSRPALQTPPQLPAIKGLDEALADYLRRFSLWSFANFNASLQKNTATGALYLQSTSGSTVWSLTIDDTGALHTTALPPGTTHP